MRILWLLCLCVVLAAPQEVLVIDNFETAGNWESLSSEGCTIKVVLDYINKKEGKTSLRLEAEFTEECDQGRCYVGISHDAPDLSDYAFLRLWIKAHTSANAIFGIYLESDKRGHFHAIPLDNTRWNLVTVPFSEFESEEEQPQPVAPEDVKTISLFLAAEGPVKVRVSIDEFVALTDFNDNGIPDIDEASMMEAAKNSEQVADQYFSEGDYEKAQKYYEEARSSYQQVGDQEKAQEMDQKVKESTAWLYYEEAEDLYSEEQYVMAAEVYEKARKEFVSAGDLDMVSSIESRLEALSELTAEDSPPPETPDQGSTDEGGIGRLLVVLVVVCLVGAGVYRWKFRGEELVKPEETSLLPSEGEELEKLVCPFCKNEIEEDWVTCPYCGVRLKDDTQVY